MPLVMETNGGWSKCAQNYLKTIILRYTMRKEMTAAAAKTYNGAADFLCVSGKWLQFLFRKK